jgi:hypothetical protein
LYKLAATVRGVARLQDLGDYFSFHDAADADRWSIGCGIVHPSPHVGIERQIGCFEENLAVSGGWNRAGFKTEIAGLRQSLGSRGEYDLAIGFHRLPLLRQGLA